MWLGESMLNRKIEYVSATLAIYNGGQKFETCAKNCVVPVATRNVKLFLKRTYGEVEDNSLLINHMFV